MKQLWSFLGVLRHHRYDRVYDLQGLGRSGFFTWVTGAQTRVGPADGREWAPLGYNHKARVDPAIPHTVDRMLAVIASDGIKPIKDMRLYVSPKDQQWAKQFCRDHHLDNQPYAVVAPTARWLSKTWPIEHFAALADRLTELDIKSAIVVASAGERHGVTPIFERAKKIQLHDLVGQTSVGQLMALLQRAEIVLCNDSAALHLAVGLGRRSVSIFGPTDPAKVGPYRYEVGVVRAEVPQVVHYRSSKLDQTLIGSVEVEQAWQTVQRVIQAPPPPVL